MVKNKKSIIAITMGDPCGIGPEVCIKGLKNQEIYRFITPVVIGDKNALEREIKHLNLSFSLNAIEYPKDAKGRYGIIDFIPGHILSDKDIIYGLPTPETGKAVYRYIEKAAKFALNGLADAITTLPVNKKVLRMAGCTYPGHTELLASLSNTPEVIMMLAGPKLRVTLVTIHIPLSEVCTKVTREQIEFTIKTTHHWLKRYLGINDPRIAVAGLNPHAGEEGLFGDEEIRVITPAIEVFRKKGINITGPLPPDTVFYLAANGKFDVVVSMYHDQALIPLKLFHFEDGVNITLGLPIIRTSVDHGTAYNIAGMGIANEKSFLAALNIAANMVSSIG